MIGLGAITNFYELPGLEERALTMKSLGDAIYLRNHLIENLEEADTECAVKMCLREPLMTCVVAGGGFAGVETIAAVNDFVREALRFYPQPDAEQIAHGAGTFRCGDPAGAQREARPLRTEEAGSARHRDALERPRDRRHRRRRDSSATAR